MVKENELLRWKNTQGCEDKTLCQGLSLRIHGHSMKVIKFALLASSAGMLLCLATILQIVSPHSYDEEWCGR